MQFLLFLLGYIVNPIILYLMPAEIAVNFLRFFTLSNIFFSLIFTYFFISIEKIDGSKKYITTTITLVSTTAFLFGGVDLIVSVSILYPFSFLVADYVTTQGSNSNHNLAYRIYLIISGLVAIAAILYNIDIFLYCIAARSFSLLMWATYINCKNSKYFNLKINHSHYFIFNTYLFYSGALLLITLLNNTDPNHTKYWYIVLQIALGLILKLIDYSTRKTNSVNEIINYSIIFVALSLVMATSVMFFNFVNLLISIIAIFGLSRVLMGIKDEK